MVAKQRRHDCLVVDAGVGHHDSHRPAGGNEPTLKFGHLLGLAKRQVMRQVDTARVGDHRDRDGTAIGGQPLDEFNAGRTE